MLVKYPQANLQEQGLDSFFPSLCANCETFLFLHLPNPPVLIHYLDTIVTLKLVSFFQEGRAICLKSLHSNCLSAVLVFFLLHSWRLLICALISFKCQSPFLHQAGGYLFQ